MRPWVAGFVGVVAVVAAVAIAAAVGDDEGTGTGPGASAASDAPAPAGGTAPSAPDPSSAAPTADAPGAFVIWARGELTTAFADAVAALPEVTAAAHVRSSTLGLTGSRDASGQPVDQPPSGYRIPVSVAAVDPSAYAATLPDGPPRTAVAALRPGTALLSETGARLRGIGPGGRIDLGALADLEVVGVLEDDAGGRAEIIIHVADAVAAGIERDGTVFLRHTAAPGPATDALAERIERLVPADLTARIVDAAAGEPRRRAPLVLSLAQVKDSFGEFAFRPRPGVREIDIDPAFPAAHIVAAEVPILGTVRCHADIIGDLRAALGAVVDAGLAVAIDPSLYGGCYHPRHISASGGRLSHHSWGIAIDINVDLSSPNLGPPPPPEVVRAFEQHGFRWGGDFLHADNHHFEWIGGEVGDPPRSTAE